MKRELLLTAMENIVECMVQDWAKANRPDVFEFASEYLSILDTIGGLLVVYENEKAGFKGNGNPG